MNQANHAERDARLTLFETDATLRLEDGTVLQGHTRDLSQSGVFLLTEKAVAVGLKDQKGEILFNIKKSYISIEKKIPCQVMRVMEDGVGLRFLKEMIFDWLDMV